MFISYSNIITWLQLRAMATFTLKTIILDFILGTVCFFGDQLLMMPTVHESDWLRVLVDETTHGLVGVFAWAAVIDFEICWSHLFEIILSLFFSCAIDVDHVLAAGTFNLKAALSLPHRPILHCTTLILLISVVLFAVSRASNSKHAKHLPLMFLVTTLSHHLRDGSRRGLWMCPFGSLSMQQYSMYIALIMILPLVAKFVVVSVDLANGFGGTIREKMEKRLDPLESV
ncbi:transmembrane protein 267-like [Lineus longissimus]|uniref:transmembrane protein 267-like n=1 Tax=Lineus longissimus TaxID=88925 RepID=UPI002B4F5D01